MSIQTATGHSFPMPCRRCGGALYRQVARCPYCGAAHPFDADAAPALHPHTRTEIPGSRASTMHKPLQSFETGLNASDPQDERSLVAHPARHDEVWPRKPAMRTALVSPDTPDPLLEEEPVYVPRNTTQTIRRVLYVLGALVAIALAYVGYTLFSDGADNEDESADSINQDARMTTGTIAPLASAPSVTQSLTADSPAAVRPTTPVVPVTPVAPVAPPVLAAPAKPPMQFRDATRALDAARLALRGNDLSKAQAALAAAQTLQPGNADAKDLAAQLRPLTERRDSALQAAQACVAQQSWPCARQHANEALAIDSGNDMAKNILERVIRETGWAPLNPHASATGAAQGKPIAQTQLQTPTPRRD